MSQFVFLNFVKVKKLKKIEKLPILNFLNSIFLFERKFIFFGDERNITEVTKEIIDAFHTDISFNIEFNVRRVSNLGLFNT